MSSFVFLVSASLTCSFGFLLSSYGRFFIKFLLSKIAEDTVAGALSLETAQCAFYVFVFSYFNRGHSFHLPLPMPYLLLRYYSNLQILCQAFFHGFSNLFPNYEEKLCRIMILFGNPLQGVCTKGR